MPRKAYAYKTSLNCEKLKKTTCLLLNRLFTFFFRLLKEYTITFWWYKLFGLKLTQKEVLLCSHWNTVSVFPLLFLFFTQMQVYAPVQRLGSDRGRADGLVQRVLVIWDGDSRPLGHWCLLRPLYRSDTHVCGWAGTNSTERSVRHPSPVRDCCWHTHSSGEMCFQAKWFLHAPPFKLCDLGCSYVITYL